MQHEHAAYVKSFLASIVIFYLNFIKQIETNEDDAKRKVEFPFCNQFAWLLESQVVFERSIFHKSGN